jgi:hypothetical protein
MHVDTYVCMLYVKVCVCVCIRMHACMHACMHMLLLLCCMHHFANSTCMHHFANSICMHHFANTHTHTHKHTHTNTHTHIQHKFTHVYAGPQRRLVHSRPLKNNIILFKYKYIRRVRDLKKNNDISIKYKIHTQGHNEGGCMRDLVCSNFTS